MAYFKHIKTTFLKTFTLKGRDSLTQYLCFQSTQLFAWIALFWGLVNEHEVYAKALMWIAGLYLLLSLLPLLTSSIRRLHDNDLSGWALFLILVPIGNLYLAWLLLRSEDEGDNKYGKAIVKAEVQPQLD